MARGDPSKAHERAAGLARASDWPERRDAVLAHAVYRTFEVNLRQRAALLSTGNEPIEARLPDEWLGTGVRGHGQNALGRALVEARDRLRVRANDADAIQCQDQDAAAVQMVCVHLLDGDTKRYRRFTGVGSTYEIVCGDCREALPAPPPLRKVCPNCVWRLSGVWGKDIGRPEIRRRPSTIRFDHRLVAVPDLLPEDVLAIQAAPRTTGDWLVVAKAGRLYRLDLGQGVIRQVAVVPSGLDLEAAVSLHVAPDMSCVALTETYGRRGVIFEPTTGQRTMDLLRDDYHPEHCSFPFTFFQSDGRLLIVHATAWNRLDVSDPATGEVLTERGPTSYRAGEPQPPHYLDYFHAGLLLSPDGRWLFDDGWVWHPIGVPRVFDLQRWVRESPWESEDGASVRTLSARDSWDLPACWLDERSIAMWGIEKDEDHDELIPGVRIVDVSTGEELRSFLGPEQGLVWDPPYLIAHEEGRGASVWDPASGELLAEDAELRPASYHPETRELVTLVPGQGFRVSRRSTG